MEFEPLFAESDVDDVEVLPEEHTNTGLWYGQSNIEIQIPVAEPIIAEETELDPLFIYPEGESFTSFMRSPEATLRYRRRETPPPPSESMCNGLCNQHDSCQQQETNFPPRKHRYVDSEPRERNFDHNGSYSDRSYHERRHSNSDHGFHDRHRNYNSINRHLGERSNSYSDRGYSDRDRIIPGRGRSYSERYRFSDRDRLHSERNNGYSRRNSDQHYSHRGNVNNNNYSDRDRDYLDRERCYDNFQRRHFGEENGRMRRMDYDEDNRTGRDSYDPRRKRSCKDNDRSTNMKLRFKNRGYNR